MKKYETKQTLLNYMKCNNKIRRRVLFLMLKYFNKQTKNIEEVGGRRKEKLKKK
jgi:hypothetical protein